MIPRRLTLNARDILHIWYELGMYDDSNSTYGLYRYMCMIVAKYTVVYKQWASEQVHGCNIQFNVGTNCTSNQYSIGI